MKRSSLTSRRRRFGIVTAASSLLTLATLFCAGGAAGATSDPTCPVSNPPDELVLVSGTPQTTKLDSVFAASFQVAFANSNGCPVTSSVAGTQVAFDAPASGASGTFAASGSSTVTVGADTNGNAVSPSFSANDIEGEYTLDAVSAYGTVAFTLTNTAVGVPALVTAEAPRSESAYTDATYARPLQALVTDANGTPIEGVAVTFTLGSGGSGGEGEAAPSALFADGQTQATVLTNASGLASSSAFSAGATAGRLSATAAVAGVTAPATFSLENVAGAPPRAVLVGPAHENALVGGTYAHPLTVRVLNASGKPLAGVAVTFSLGSGASSGTAGAAGATFLGGGTQVNATTGERGRAVSPPIVANDSSGAFSATIAVAGLTKPLVVGLDNSSAAPARIALTADDRTQHATVESDYAHPLELRVRAADGQPEQGVTVTFTLGNASAGSGGAATAGASFLGGAAQVSETTDAAGLAVSPGFIANDSPGRFTATAAAAGVTDPLSITLDNVAAAPARVVALGRFVSTTVDSRFARPLEVVVRDSRGRPLEGISVTFTLGGGAGSGGTGAGALFASAGSQATVATDASGRAVSPALIANSTAGSFDAVATIAGSAVAATFDLRNRAGAPSTLSAGAGATQQTAPGTRFAIPLAVTVSDIDKNPVAGVAVTFTAPARGPGGSFSGGRRRVTVRTNADGVAVAPPFKADGRSGGYAVSASVGGLAAAFALVNESASST